MFDQYYIIGKGQDNLYCSLKKIPIPPPNKIDVTQYNNII